MSGIISIFILAVFVSGTAIFLSGLPPLMGFQRILEITGGALIAIYFERVITKKKM